MWYEIIPNDTLFFRDGRPFTMGAETWANSIFPPYPSTVYGAIRSWLIFEKGNLKDFYEGKFENELGTKQKKGNLKIKGPILTIDQILYFPIPKDMLTKDNSELLSLTLTKKNNVFISDYELERILINKSNGNAKEAEGFFNIYNLINYLKDEKKILEYVENKKIFTYEIKTGIKRNIKTFQTEEGYLYRIPMIRMLKNTSLIVKIEGTENIPENGIIQLGGEGKTFKIRKIDKEFFKSFDNINFKFESNLFKLVLITPAIFKKGWIPEWVDEKSLEGVKDGVKLKLISCAIGKHLLIGGWDIANKQPKKMRKAVSAGSVYYFEIIEGKDKIKSVFHLKNISDINPDEGFGLSLIGEVKL